MTPRVDKKSGAKRSSDETQPTTYMFQYTMIKVPNKTLNGDSGREVAGKSDSMSRKSEI